MLHHQHVVTEWYIDSFGLLPHLQAYLASPSSIVDVAGVMTPSSMHG